MAIARVFILFALCHVSSSLLLTNWGQIKTTAGDPSLARNGDGQPPSATDIQSANKVVEMMRASPNNATAQAYGCYLLADVLDRHAADANDAALPAIEAMADAIASGREAGLTCINWLGTAAVFNRPMTLMINRTNAMKNTVEFLRANVDDWDAGQISNNIASMSTQQDVVGKTVQLGGIDVLFDYLDRWQTDAHATLMAWAGLSDPSHAAVGARAIADHGGYHKGIDFVIQKIHSYPAHFGASPDTLTVRYESLQIVNGMLEHDETNEYAHAFLEKGLLQEVIKTMEEESDMRAATSVCCSILWALLGRGNGPTMMPTLQKRGVVDLINKAFTTFHEDFPMPWNGMTVGQAYKVIPECSMVLSEMASSSTESKQHMLDIGLPQTIQNVRPDLQNELPVRDLQIVLA